MLAHNECGLDIGDLCVVTHEEGSPTPKAQSPGIKTPTHRVVWLKQVVGDWRSIVAIEELPEEVFTDEKILNLCWILVGCVVVLLLQVLLAPPPIP